jgi:hypothetical protein
MILVPSKNIWTPERKWKGPRFQRGVLHPVGFWHPVTEVVTLSGTSGAPNLSTDVETVPTNALAGWRFRANGTVERIVSDVWTQFQDGVEWVDTQDTPTGPFWIKATVDSGDAPNVGNSVDLWFSLAALVTWAWEENSDPLNEATTEGVIQVDISDESDGTPILDTGFYKGTATQFGTA